MQEANPRNGLIADSTRPGAPASIAAVGLALSSYPVGVERGFIPRAKARERTLKTLRFFHGSTQSRAANATGFKGFYYHYLDMDTGRRVWRCELSTIDTAFLIAGMLVAAAYFSSRHREERSIRTLADQLYRRVDWQWAQNGGATVTHGWRPERGFLKYRWEGYNEALFLYLLGLGSPTHPLPAESFARWADSYEWRTYRGRKFLYSGPLFTHQISHLWIDFRKIRDATMRRHRSDYFENSRRATQVQRAYAMANPGGFSSYGPECWGITASDGPGPARRWINGRRQTFFGYKARGAPYGPDDGSISPWAVVASLPFAPEIVLPALKHFNDAKLRKKSGDGFRATLNPTFPGRSNPPRPWISPFFLGLNQGPMVLMIENYRTGLLWKLTKKCPPFVLGLRRAGFTGGWLRDARDDVDAE
ncbi:MAG: glucoamylase family protein [Opitutaceae bacterium]